MGNFFLSTKNIKHRILLIFMGIFLSLSNVNYAIADDTIAQWRLYDKHKTSFYYTNSEMPKGSTVKIKVVSVGSKSDAVKVSQFIGLGTVKEHKKQWANLANGQVLSYTLPYTMKIDIEVGGLNFARKPISIVNRNGFHEMKFQGGWILQAKIIGESF